MADLNFEIDRLMEPNKNPENMKKYEGRFISIETEATIETLTKETHALNRLKDAKSKHALLPYFNKVLILYEKDKPIIDKKNIFATFGRYLDLIILDTEIPTKDIWDASENYSDSLVKVTTEFYVAYMKLLDLRARALQEEVLPKETTGGRLIGTRLFN